MNKRLTRFAAVALAATLFVAFAEKVHAGAGPGKTQPQTGSKSAAAKPQPQPQLQQTKPPQPKPQPARPQTSSTIGSLNSSNSQPVIGTLKPSNPSSQPVIGTLKPSNPSSQPIIGTVSPIDPIIHGSDIIGGQEKPVEPVIPPPPPEPGPKVEPVLPPSPQQTVQQGPSAPASDGPLIVQDEPAQSEPIIITPRTVRAGNVQSGGNRGQHEYGPGYSGGNGNGPLIYNP